MTTDLSAYDLFATELMSVVHPFAMRRAPAAVRSTHEQIGFDLGRDHARYGVTPTAPSAQEPSALRQGWRSGAATFGTRTLTPTVAVHQWLQLRLHAWLRGRSVELVQVTPHYLQRLAGSHCPITREALRGADGEPQAASIDRVRHDAAYAAGNLVVMSTRAQIAKAALHKNRDGLTAAQWARVAVLCSFVEPLPHAQAAELSLRVLPPNRLRLFNPVQALQAFISQQLLSPGWSVRINTIEALLPGLPARRAFRSFFQTLLPRVLEAGRPTDPQRARWAVEDAWGHAAVMQRWVRFAQRLTAAQCEALLSRAATEGLLPAGLRLEALADAQAIDGWCLDTQGQVPPGPSHGFGSRGALPLDRTLH